MNQKMLKKFLVGLLAFNIFTTIAFSTQGNDSKITYAQEKQDFTFVVSDQNGPIMNKDFTFEILNEKGEITEVQSMMSMLNLKLSDGKYTIRLKDAEYTMKDVSFTVTDGEIPNYDSIVNLMLTKKKVEEKAKEIQITIMLTTQKGEVKDVVMGNYEFEIYNQETGKLVTTATSDKSMLNLKLPDGIYTLKLKENNDYTMKDVRLDVYADDGSYTIDEKESMELNLVKIKSENEKPENEETNGSKEVLVRVLFGGKPKVDFKVGLMEFDPIPNIIQQGSTNEKGEVKFSGFKSNVKYQLRLRSTDKTMTFETEVFEFTTNEKGLITKINDKEVNSKEDAVVEFRGSNKDSEKFKTFPVEFYAKYKDGTPAKGVEFSINRLSPRLSSYRKVKSDENGKVVFMLEGEAPKDASFGRLYNITISKMEMFKHKSVPFGMDFTVDDKGNVKVISVEREIGDKDTDTSNPDKYNKTFTLEKEDKTHIYNEFKAQYEKVVEYLKNTKFENSKESNKAKKDLENVIFASKAELEETIPEYALKKTDELKNAMDNLKKFEIANENPSKSEEKVNKIVNSKEKVTVESEGLNAKLKLIVKRLDKNTVETLKNKNADLFDIFFTLGNGTEKMPKQNYKVTLEKRKGETVKQVCYVNEDGKLEKLEFTQDDKNVTFTTTHFSKYAVIYENKSEVKREVKKDVKKAQKMPKTSISGISLAVPTLLFGVMIVINKKRNK
ncbi:hypothetical protein [Parvimonas micra]|uniref:hypothetical protein n=1 Tax=Parvimonas micra TaxID=33033 RepID=UPI002002C0FA|nr:hypothetical protein [Parvimonas micra]MCK6130918.1 hypothetical protein [Parvimonas micra]MCK6136563.1 hypothetical protein [Parvimonas micra]MCK6138034.1 hypothetical protein [Parvimonas micra]MCK6154562.1 hypothetical protein [Parvimonas micra]